MNPQDPLANLHPLREPGLIGWWPLAPGWWLLLAVGLLCLAALLYWLLRRYKSNAYKRRALEQLQALHAQYLLDNDGSHYVTQTNALLKSVALLAYPRRDVAPNSGEAWREFLNHSVRCGDQFGEEFATAAYQKECPQMDMEQVHRAAQNWIRHHGVAQ